MGAAGYRRASELYGEQLVQERFVRVINELLRGKAGRGKDGAAFSGNA
jgi:hypothetical protein